MEYDVAYWQEQLKLSEKSLEKFTTAGDKVVGHYLDEDSAAMPQEGLGAHKVNMFWANVGILKSALYGNPPKPIAAREFQDPEDDVARVAAAIIERLLRTGPNGSGKDMHEAFQHAVEDRLIPGMGQVWLRYDAQVEVVDFQGIKVQQIKSEDVHTDYVYWKDFRYSPCRVWEECTWVARRVWMPKTRLKKRFPKFADRIPMVVTKDDKTSEPTTQQANTPLLRGEIYEIWCKESKKVYWIAKGLEHMLDEKEDPLEIPDFFPCPRPLVANQTTKKFIGRADYTMVQDQYSQLNSINIRLGYLIEACKAVGVYDKTADGVQRMLGQGAENQLIPVDNWAMFAEKGGIKGVVDWMPIEAIVAVIEKLREARVDCVQQIYELTGISDIMRGVTNARETYGAQQLKAQYSSSRLQLYQMQVGSFVAGAMDIKANIMAKHFQPETLIKKSLVMYTPDKEFAEPAVQLIKDSYQLMYRINVSSTQMSIPDYNAEKQMRQEYVNSMGQFVGQITPLLEKAPSAAPFMLKILQWVGASFSSSGGVETLFDNYIRAVEKQLAQPKGPDPEIAKAQAEAQAKAQAGQMEMQGKQSLAQFDAQAKSQLAQIEAQTKQQLAELETASKERIAKLQSDTQLQIAEIKQGDLFAGEVADLEQKTRDLEEAKRELELAQKAGDLQQKYILDNAFLEVKKVADQHELRVSTSIAKAQTDATKVENKESQKESKAEIAGMQKMQSDLVKSVGSIMDELKAMSGPKSIKISLPDGGEATANVSAQGKEGRSVDIDLPDGKSAKAKLTPKKET